MKKLEKTLLFRREGLNERTCCGHISTNRSCAKTSQYVRAKKKKKKRKESYELAGLHE